MLILQEKKKRWDMSKEAMMVGGLVGGLVGALVGKRMLTASEAVAAEETSSYFPIGAAGPGTPQLLGATSGGGGVLGSFPVSFVNNTAAYEDDDIHVMIMYEATPKMWYWVDRTGVARRIDHNASENPETRLRKKDLNYAKMSFTLAEARDLVVPPECIGARIYISLGEPLYIGISSNDLGWKTPNPCDTNDPNYSTIYDWYEMTFKNGTVSFGGNTTQVDQFGFPFTFTLKQDSSSFSSTRGINLSRDEVFQKFEQTMPKEFQSLVIRNDDDKPLRLLAPRSWQPGALANWLKQPIEDFWNKYGKEDFLYERRTLNRLGVLLTVTGKVVENQFTYTVTHPGDPPTSHKMDKPTTAQVFSANGPFEGTRWQGSFLAELNAAFNRGVAASPSTWQDSTAFYPSGQRWNDWARFFHTCNLDALAYGFPYDDVESQSSVLILGNSDPPTNVTFALN